MVTRVTTFSRFWAAFILGTIILFTSPANSKPTKAEGEAALQAALAVMEQMCDKCCKDNLEKCKADAKAIVDAIVAAWNTNYGNGSNDGADNIGGYLCWDWARFFRDAANSVGSTTWTADHGMAFKKPPPTAGQSGVCHYWVNLYPCGNREDTCKVMIDDGWMNASVFVHTEPWPNPERWEKQNLPIPALTPKKTGPDDLAAIITIAVTFIILFVLRKKQWMQMTMKLHMLLITIFFAGFMSCQNTGGKISIGMDWIDAQKVLDGANAKKTQLDAIMIVPSDLHGSEFYELKNGNLLMTAYSRPAASDPYRVSGLELCTNPNAAKEDRKWESIKEVAL